MDLPNGYSIRNATHKDRPALGQLFALVDAAEGAEPAYDAEDLYVDWNEPTFSLERDTFVVSAPDGSISAYAQVEARPPDQVYSIGWVHPDHMGRGLGTWLVEQTEGRAVEIARQNPQMSTLRNGTSAADAAAAEIMKKAGYSVIRRFFHMSAELGLVQEKPIDGIEIRPLSDIDTEPRILHGVLDIAFKDHWGSAFPTFDHWWVGYTSRAGFDQSFSFIAWAGDKAVGGLAAELSPTGLGWIGDLGVLPDWRGRGVGEALLLRCFKFMAGLGLKEVRLGVDAANETGATRLYERVGMKQVRQFDFYEKALPPPLGRSNS